MAVIRPDIPGPVIIKIMRDLGYDPFKPTDEDSFYKEWIRLSRRDRLDMLSTVAKDMYGH